MKSFAIRFAEIGLLGLGAAFSTCASAQVAARPNPADPSVANAPTRYESFLPAKAADKATGSPVDYWIEANRTVAAVDTMSLTMGGHEMANGAADGDRTQAPQQSSSVDAHAGHSMPQPRAMPAHAGHEMAPGQVRAAPAPRAAAANSATHQGHNMVEVRPDRPAPAPVKKRAPTDPHAGHMMMPAAPDPHAGHRDMEKK